MTLDHKRQAILDSLYHHCQTRTYTSKEVLAKVLQDITSFPDENAKIKLLDIIREYKNTGKNLEATVNTIYDVLYPNRDDDTGKVNSWNPHEP